ncbi:MAG TPA: HAMP domain-containing sensor histidine kinase [Cytophagaceae bacterium]|jgi:signal transduction histidine kinase|nr:HAMP domain-containing sensor histidine kinase [Cytophagaceae bacterium]
MTGKEFNDLKKNTVPSISLYEHAKQWDTIIIDEEYLIHHVSANFLKVSGYLREDLYGKNLNSMALNTEKDYSLFTLDKYNFNNVTFACRNKYNQICCFLLNGFHFSEEGVHYVVLFWNDISIYHHYEKLYLGKEVELDTLVYKLSHDLRGPVATLKGLMQLAKSDISKDNCATYMDMLLLQAEKMDATINELTYISELAEGRQYIFSKIDLGQLVNKSIENISKRNNVYDTLFKFDMSIDYSIKTYEFALMSVLYQCFLLCIENRAPDTIHTIDFSANLKNNSVLALVIKDNGKGMNRQYIDKAFSPFFKINQSTHVSGLSLFTLKKCVEFLNGTITLSSNIGCGMEFMIEIPVTSE